MDRSSAREASANLRLRPKPSGPTVPPCWSPAAGPGQLVRRGELRPRALARKRVREGFLAAAKYVRSIQNAHASCGSMFFHGVLTVQNSKDMGIRAILITFIETLWHASHSSQDETIHVFLKPSGHGPH